VASFPTVHRWATLLPRQGGGRTIEAFDDKFFDWWAREILVIEDYPYAGIKFFQGSEYAHTSWRGARRDRYVCF
jgi:hypothetical protein